MNVKITLYCRMGHSRVASLAALPQFTFCPHPALRLHFIFHSPFKMLNYAKYSAKVLMIS